MNTMRSFLLALLLCTTYSAIGGHVQRYDNYQVFSVRADTEAHQEALALWEHGHPGGDISLWNNVRLGRPSDVMVPPHKLAEFVDVVDRLKLNSTRMISNVQRLIDNEQSSGQPGSFGWTSYQTLDEIYAWLDTLLVRHSNILTNIDVGQSYENRTIRAIKLSHKSGNPAIFIESNIHACEWITSATATWLLNELLTSQEPDVVELARNFDWYIVPVLNVDGLVYTHQHDRMWRKTRRPHSLFCTGADPNRNFDRYWRQHNGATNNPCSRQYAGPKSASEQEIVAYTRFYQSIAKSVKMYLAFHSYGQLIMTPHSHSTVRPDNYDDLMAVGLKGKEAIAVRYGTEYSVGSIADVMTIASGSSIDWVVGIEGLRLVFAFEFRPKTGDAYGFLLPADQILPNALEVFDGIKAMIVEARKLKYF